MHRDPTKLLLFDIDGTLVTMRQGLPREIFESMVRDLFDMDVDLTGFDYSGKPDKLIVQQIGERTGLSPAVIELHHDRAMDYVARSLERVMDPQSLALLPGVRPLLERLHQREDVLLGILTGNTPRGAAVKLSVHGLTDYFSFGVFGDETNDRNALGPLAIERAAALLDGKRFAGKDVVIIGDSLRDAECANAIGATAVITLTGKTMRSEFERFDPDHIFDDLSDTEAFERAVFGNAYTEA